MKVNITSSRLSSSVCLSSFVVFVGLSYKDTVSKEQKTMQGTRKDSRSVRGDVGFYPLRLMLTFLLPEQGTNNTYASAFYHCWWWYYYVFVYIFPWLNGIFQETSTMNESEPSSVTICLTSSLCTMPGVCLSPSLCTMPHVCLPLHLYVQCQVCVYLHIATMPRVCLWLQGRGSPVVGRTQKEPMEAASRALRGRIKRPPRYDLHSHVES